MEQEKTKKEEEAQCEKCVGCAECQGCIFVKPDDLKNVGAGLGFRFFISLGTVLLLGFGVKENADSFMLSSLIYALPLLREYFSFIPRQKSRKTFRNIQRVLLTVLVIISALYMADILISISVILPEKKIFIGINPEWAFSPVGEISIVYIWVIQLAAAFLTGLDWFIYQPEIKSQPVGCGVEA